MSMQPSCPTAKSPSTCPTRRSTTRTHSPSPARHRSRSPSRWCRASTSRASSPNRARTPTSPVGTRVLVNGWGHGRVALGRTRRATHAGARVIGSCLFRTLFPMSKTMAIGTAGYTAMLCVMALGRRLESRRIHGDVLVTGAAGGVGSVAISVLSEARVSGPRGHRPRCTRPTISRAWARRISWPRDELTGKVRALGKQRWAGRGGRRRQHGPGQRAVDDQVRRRGGRVWPRRAAWICRRRSRRSSCAAFACSASTRCTRRSPRRLTAWTAAWRTSSNFEHLAAMTSGRGSRGSGHRRRAEVLAGQTRGRVVVDVRR